MWVFLHTLIGTGLLETSEKFSPCVIIALSYLPAKNPTEWDKSNPLRKGEQNFNSWRIHGLCVNSTNEEHVLPIDQAPYLIKRIRAQR